jgi:UDP-glucose 6-dehydrogenase
MAYKFAKHSGNKTFEAFDLELDHQSQSDFNADPTGFIRKTIAAEKAAPPNRIIIGSGVQSSKPIRMYHQVLPESEAWTYIVTNTDRAQ